MNKILSLFDEKTALDLFTVEILPHYPDFRSISRITINPYKKLVWETTYHVVIAFDVYFLTAADREERMPIVCTAHSDEPRSNVYAALKYLWAGNFPNSDFDLPEPLFYSEYFRGTFYRGLDGEPLLRYIKNKDYIQTEKIVARAAELFARLHTLPISPTANFNPINSHIKTVVPGTAKIYSEMGARYHNKYDEDLRLIYSHLISREEEFLSSDASLTLIHGDAHPENIIVTLSGKTGLIDFSDMCLGDFARDLGAFCQQLEYKIVSKMEDETFAARMKELFLSHYLSVVGLELTEELRRRIDLYYNWTAMRTAVYWFLKFGHNEERAEKLISKVKDNLKL
jgi:aminoglycoside phosphotransferase (APT) family kinase protein